MGQVLESVEEESLPSNTRGAGLKVVLATFVVVNQALVLVV